MCGRASLTKIEKDLAERYNATFFPLESEQHAGTLPNYNIAPTQMHPVLLDEDPKHLHYLRWGLIPFWAKDAKIGSRLINARSETVAEKPSFRDSFKRRRCLVPFDGFYEWKRTASGKTPYRITLKDEGIFSIAGLWSHWKSKTGPEEYYTFTLLTQPPNTLLADIHDRMPVILLPEEERAWLDHSLSANELQKLIRPYPDEQMQAYPVSTAVNNVRNNDASLIEPIDG